MHSQNTVSTTLPVEDGHVQPEADETGTPLPAEDPEDPNVNVDIYDADDNYDPAHDRDVEKWQRQEVAAEPPPRRRPDSSRVWPVSPPPAQPDQIPMPVYVDHQVFVHTHAAPGADVTEALDEFVLRVRPGLVVDVRPIQAVQWKHAFPPHRNLQPPCRIHMM